MSGRVARKKRKEGKALIDLMPKVAIYIRVSTQMQIDKDSLPVQRLELINYCKYVLNITDFVVFEDAGYSAKNTDRPDFQKMMARVRTGEFSHILVWKIDRISRNLIDFATMYEEMKRLGVTFVSKNEQFDTSSAMGEAMLKIILVFAELERKVTSERVSAIMISRASNGSWNGGRIAMGYGHDKESGEFFIIESEASIVRLIYDTYEREKSLVATAKVMNEKGLKSRRGYAWNPTTINIILRNPFYVGTYRWNYRDEAQTGNSGHDFKPEDEWIMNENHHPAIIDKEQWERIGAQLTKNNRILGSGLSYNRGNVHVFAGLLFCGYCGSVMTATPDKVRADGWRPSVYSCSRKRRHNDCPNKYISDYVVGSFALNYIANMMKAQRSFGRSTSIATLEKKLLRGYDFEKVECIENAGLREFYDTLRRHKIPDDRFVIKERPPASDDAVQEIDLLVTEKRRSERALARLQSIFLYGEDAMAETDYLNEKQRITAEIAVIDARMEELEKNRASQFSMTDEDFIEKASYFILSQQLTDAREVDYDKYIRKIDPRIVRDFLDSVVQNFCIKSGKIASVRFKNGLEHKFLYRETE